MGCGLSRRFWWEVVIVEMNEPAVIARGEVIAVYVACYPAQRVASSMVPAIQMLVSEVQSESSN